MAGVLMGSLAASIIKPTQYLLGASPGVYALISAHLGEAKMIKNYTPNPCYDKTYVRNSNPLKTLSFLYQSSKRWSSTLYIILQVYPHPGSNIHH